MKTSEIWDENQRASKDKEQVPDFVSVDAEDYIKVKISEIIRVKNAAWNKAVEACIYTLSDHPEYEQLKEKLGINKR